MLSFSINETPVVAVNVPTVTEIPRMGTECADTALLESQEFERLCNVVNEYKLEVELGNVFMDMLQHKVTLKEGKKKVLSISSRIKPIDIEKVLNEVV